MRHAMFSFRHDKVGFVFGLALIIICGGTFIATLVLLLVGTWLGDFKMFLWPIRWVVSGWWLACIVVVLSRVYILNWQMQQRRRMALESPPLSPPDASASLPPLTPDAEVARARADAERYRAIRAIGVSTILGVATALIIVTALNAGIPDRPGVVPVLIVAWSVSGGGCFAAVLVCVIGLRRRDPRPPSSRPPP